MKQIHFVLSILLATLPCSCGNDEKPKSIFSPQGHLLVLENFNEIKLNHGLMEAGYIDHQVATSSDSATADSEQTLLSISMTATIDAKGNLVLGNRITI